MALTHTQMQTIKTAINADPALAAIPNTPDGGVAIAAALNAEGTPAYWVWRTSVTRADIYNTVDWEAGSWNWTTYKNQGVSEQNAWTQMFMGDIANFAQANVRAGIAAIFAGSAQATAQRDHCLSVGRRKATRAEALLAAGPGTTASPSTLTFEGVLSYQDIQDARSS